MRNMLNGFLLLATMTLPALAQIPSPQINLTGNIGCVGFPCVNSGTLIMSADADRTMTALETSAFYLKVTSSVPLTATRNLIAPLGNFPFTIENATTGGQAIQIIGTTGTGVTIPNGETVAVWNDGTNFVQIGSAGGGTPGGSNTDVQYNNSGAFGGYPLTNFILSTGNQTITYNNNGASTLTIANPNAGSSAASGYLASNGTDFFALELAGTGTGIPGATSFVSSSATAPMSFQTGGGPLLFNAANANFSGALNYAADTGTANAYVVSPPSCVSAAHDGITINFKAANASTGASTLAYCPGSTLPLVKNGSTALTTGDILAGAQYSARYNAAVPNWQLLNSSLSAGGSPGGSNGNPQINASSSFGAAANVIYQQSGDTIASIETACSSLCTYVVTSPQTITLSASHAMNSNVWLRFEADGQWTVNGSTYVLSNVQVAPGTTATDHFPAGSGTLKLGLYNTVVPVEWFGAVAGGSASTNLTAIQTTANSMIAGQVKFSAMYSIAGTVAFPNGIGAQGIPAFRGGVPSSYLSGLTETVAGDDAIDQHGTSGSYITGGKFQDFAVLSSVAQTGTAAGISCSFAGGTIANNLFVSDFIYDVYAHACPSYGGPGWNGIATGHDSLIASGSVYGFFLDSGDGYPESSITIRNSTYADASNGSHTSTAMLVQGTAINDVNVFNFNVAQPSGWGVHINSTASGTLAASDLHFVSLTVDGSTAGSVPVEIDGVAGSAGGTITFTDARLSTTHNPAEMFYIHQSQNIQLLGSQLEGGQIGVEINAGGSTGNVIANNVILDNSSEAVWVNGPQNAISGNSIGGTTTTGIVFNSAGGNNNTYGLNTCASSVTTCVSDSGTGNGLQVVYGTATSAVVSAWMPSLGTGNIALEQFGVNSSSDNYVRFLFTNAGGAGSSLNYASAYFGGSPVYNFSWFANGSTEFGETSSAAGPANGIAVGTTGQFQVSGAGAVTAPSIAINGGTAITSSTTANSQVVTVAAGTRALGYTTLSSGTITISNAAACTASATCVYKLTNCGTNSSAALGTLTIGTITAGTSFVINSESAAAALVTTDNSHVCWQIN